MKKINLNSHHAPTEYYIPKLVHYTQVLGKKVSVYTSWAQYLGTTTVKK